MSGSEGLAATAMAGMAISSVGSAWSQSAAYQMQGAYSSAQAELNSKIADLQAEDSMKRGNAAVTQQKKAVKQLIGTQRADMAAQGIALDSGSALDVQESTAQMGALDAITIKNNAMREAWGYKMAAVESAGQAAYAANSGNFMAGTTLLTGGMNAANYGLQGAYYYNKKG